ncbi:MAG: HAMP domain-containing histidine kinase [Eubacterium sp.]|jgi:signal transduction histidine kinase|nr:HAMP domain-containing histidine kinase [Eubacterium sp.]
MNDQLLIFLLSGVLVLLMLTILYQRFAFTKGIHAELKKISETLSAILETDSEEKVMVFTDDQMVQSLCAQINRLLEDRQKIRVDYRKQELSSKKMLSNISHDIKTPLTVILGYLEILRLKDPENAALQKTEVKAKQVMELIDHFFTLAKLEAGDRNLEITKVNITEICRENVLEFYEILQQREFTVELMIPEKSIYVQGEKKSVERILNNLISNVLRYGSDGNYIGVFLREDMEDVSIDVADRGKGIEKEFADSVFERLYTMEDSRNRKIQGNGLGLTIARNLARQMGGDILLESEPGRRTVFTVVLKK